MGLVRAVESCTRVRKTGVLYRIITGPRPRRLRPPDSENRPVRTALARVAGDVRRTDGRHRGYGRAFVGVRQRGGVWPRVPPEPDRSACAGWVRPISGRSDSPRCIRRSRPFGPNHIHVVALLGEHLHTHRDKGGQWRQKRDRGPHPSGKRFRLALCGATPAPCHASAPLAVASRALRDPALAGRSTGRRSKYRRLRAYWPPVDRVGAFRPSSRRADGALGHHRRVRPRSRSPGRRPTSPAPSR